MKPISVRFKCFGPYMDEQFVDFEALQKSGLFLICGETGAGKTTILDAICYALYGKSSGGLRGDLEVMRCKLAGQGDETLVEFVFDCGGKRYKFVRSLKYGRKNLNDSHNCLVLEGEEYVPIFENPKATFVNKKAEELIGLSYDQFRQVILLPQGQFEKLLVSDSAEKEKILVSLFRADRWQKMAEELYRRVAEQDTALKQQRQEMTGRLRAYGADSLEKLADKKQDQLLLAEALRGQRECARHQVLQCRKAQEQAALTISDFEELERREKQLLELEKQLSRFASEEMLLQKSDRAEQLRPRYLAWQNARREHIRLTGHAAAAEAALVKAQKTAADTEMEWQKHIQQQPEYEKARQRILLLDTARELYDTLDAKREAALRALQLLKREKIACETARKELACRDQLWQQAVLAQDQAIRAYQQLQEDYLRGIGGTLAEKLVTGQPCPVCGSREHPAPAPRLPRQVTDAQLEQGKGKMNRALAMESEARENRKTAETAAGTAADRYNEAMQQEAVCRRDYEDAMTRRIPGLEDSIMLRQERQRLQGKLERYEGQEAVLKDNMVDAAAALTGAQSRMKGIREELAAAQVQLASETASWQAALEATGFSSEEEYRAADMDPGQRQQRMKALSRFRAEHSAALTAAEQQRKKLDGVEKPDQKALQKEMAAADREFTQLTSRCVLAEEQLKNMEKDLADLTCRQQEYVLQRQRVDADLEFANRLRGRSGVSLQRYVLGVMLTNVTSAANELLKGVCGGRYRLYRTDEIAGSGRKGGLELEVYDSRTNARRSVTTLSGGEKFLVALSLAIGLSTVVQAQGSGIRLEAMFIDEGFGSLDREAVNDALEVLQGIQRSAGVVGIISHVESLTETIPVRLEVTRERNGSRCVLHQ